METITTNPCSKCRCTKVHITDFNSLERIAGIDGVAICTECGYMITVPREIRWQDDPRQQVIETWELANPSINEEIYEIKPKIKRLNRKLMKLNAEKKKTASKQKQKKEDTLTNSLKEITIDDIIEAAGGADKIAIAANLSLQAIDLWKRNGIPAKHWSAIMQLIHLNDRAPTTIQISDLFEASERLKLRIA